MFTLMQLLKENIVSNSPKTKGECVNRITQVSWYASPTAGKCLRLTRLSCHSRPTCKYFSIIVRTVHRTI